MSDRSYDPARVFVRVFGFAEGLEWGFWLAATVWWVVVLELGPLELVVMGAVLEITVLLSETPTGVVADLVSRRRSLIIAHVVMGTAFIWAVASTNYWVILPAQALFGVGWTFKSGADTAWVTDELRGMGRGDDTHIEQLLIHKHRFGMAVALGTMTFVMVLGTLTSVRWAAAVLGLLTVALAGLLRLVLHEHHFTPGHEHGRGFLDTLRAGFRVVVGRPRLRILVAVIVALDLGSEAFDRLGHKYFLDNGGFEDNSLVGLWALFIVLALAGLIVNRVAQVLLGRGMGVARLASMLLFVAALGGMLTAATGFVVVMGLGLTLQDSTRETLWPVLEGWANRDAPTEVRATVHSLMGQTTAIGELVGGLTLGVVAEATGVRTVLVIAALFWFASSAIATRGIAR